MRYRALVDQRELSLEVRVEGDRLVAGVGDQMGPVDFAGNGGYGPFSLVLDGRSYEAYICPAEDGVDVYLGGRVFRVALEEERRHRLGALTRGSRRQEGHAEVKAPMPGLVRAVHVRIGDQVVAGRSLVVLEAMKMENDLMAPRAGVVHALHVVQGDKVEQGRVLVVLH